MKNRIRAFLIHLFISGIVALAAVYVVFYIWYPAPLHEAAGVTRIFLLLLAVDVVIGPTLTLIVFKTNKPSLKLDLSIIALLQLSALAYGMNTVFEGRPAFVVFSVDRFELGRACDLDPESMNKALESGNQAAIAGWTQPRWVAAVASKDAKRGRDILFSALQGGPDWPQLPELFVPLTQVKEQMLAKARPVEELREQLRKNRSTANLDDAKDTKWLPLQGKARNMAVLINARNADVIKILDIDPWSFSTAK
jgi:hypothetical protein